MRLLRTAAGGFINAAKIVRLATDREQTASVVAVLDDGQEVALASYYQAGSSFAAVSAWNGVPRAAS
jgi:hypothetical protein